MRALRLITANEWAGLALAGVWVWFGGLTLRLLVPRLKPAISAVITPVAIVVLVILALAGISGWLASRTVAVIVIPDTTARYGPLEESQSAFTLPDGAELRLTDRKGDWLGIRDASGRSGWVMARNVQIVP